MHRNLIKMSELNSPVGDALNLTLVVLATGQLALHMHPLEHLQDTATF